MSVKNESTVNYLDFPQISHNNSKKNNDKGDGRCNNKKCAQDI